MKHQTIYKKKLHKAIIERYKELESISKVHGWLTDNGHTDISRTTLGRFITDWNNNELDNHSAIEAFKNAADSIEPKKIALQVDKSPPAPEEDNQEIESLDPSDWKGLLDKLFVNLAYRAYKASTKKSNIPRELVQNLKDIENMLQSNGGLVGTQSKSDFEQQFGT